MLIHKCPLVRFHKMKELYWYLKILLPNSTNFPNSPRTLEGTTLENVESIKYLGVTITSDLRWNTHVSNVCTKANRTLGFLSRNLYSCPQEVKEAAYKGLVHPVLDYGSSVWDPPGVVLQEELESVQKRAARFVTGNYNYETGSMTGILGQLKWESLKKRRKDNKLILLYKGLKGKASVPTDDLIPKTRRCRHQHSMAFQTPIANTDVYKGSFFPQTIRDWNALPDSLISSAEDAEDCVAKFTSLVRELGTNSLITGPGEWLSFRRFTSKPSWSWSQCAHGKSSIARKLEDRPKTLQIYW